MLLIPCPWCGAREEVEFRYGGEARHQPAPNADDHALADYLFYRSNPAGRHVERWVHVHGCRRWFTLVRDTMTHEIQESYFRPPDAS
ncbi:MAG: sarcosine oxidase subunit delta [Gemmatimonadota bacterium]